MICLAKDQEYQSMRREFRRLVGVGEDTNIAHSVLLELFRTHPEPHWVKFANGRMFAINQEYSDKYNAPLIDYINSSDSDIWSDETSDQFSVNDKQVLVSGQAMRFREKCEKEDIISYVDVIKWPLKITDNTGRELVFIAGKTIEG